MNGGSGLSRYNHKVIFIYNALPGERVEAWVSKDKKVLNALCEKQPKRIVYLSCNIATCARDLRLLSTQYHIIFKEVYNFFPATPHIEFLTVLDRK